MKIKLLKIYRFILLYGIRRTISKIASRYDNVFMKYLLLNTFGIQKEKFISIIGCGQYGFSTISYLLLKTQGKHFLECYDVDVKRSELTSKFFNYKVQKDVNKLLSNPKCKLIYIASNHHSHTDYAIQALKYGKDVYVEKPISVTFDQFYLLKETIKNSSNRVFAGYNRPYSKAVKKIDGFIKNNKSALSLNCFISGHFIEQDHWYRVPKEGTRICGNVGHWIDLMVHLMNIRGFIPKQFDITISHANNIEIDDNLVISIRTDFEDIISIFITSRTEPFEGINETINLQCGDVIAKVDDFKRLTIWKNEYKLKLKYWRKDVGHRLSINQPFLAQEEIRDWNEIEISTFLMLEITDMVRLNKKSKLISI